MRRTPPMGCDVRRSKRGDLDPPPLHSISVLERIQVGGLACISQTGQSNEGTSSLWIAVVRVADKHPNVLPWNPPSNRQKFDVIDTPSEGTCTVSGVWKWGEVKIK